MTTEQKRKGESSTSLEPVDHENFVERAATLADIDGILKPLTPRDQGVLLTWFVRHAPRICDAIGVRGFDGWRSKTTKLKGVYFCAACEQILGTDHCPECDLPIPGVLPTRFDVGMDSGGEE